MGREGGPDFEAIGRVAHGKQQTEKAFDEAYRRFTDKRGRETDELLPLTTSGELGRMNDETGEKTKAYLSKYKSKLSPEAQFYLQMLIAKREQESAD